MQGPSLANRIVELAVKTPKFSTPSNEVSSTTAAPSSSRVPTAKSLNLNNQNLLNDILSKDLQSSPPPKLSQAELEAGKKDIESVNKDLALLSTLLGRPVTLNDIPNLTKPNKGSVATTTVHNEVADLSGLLNEQTRVKSAVSSGSSDPKANLPQYYGKTDDAVLASILKEQGIGPVHNNVPVEQLLQQTHSSTTPFLRPVQITPRPIAPQPPRRPIVDGLAWLWRTWQDTAPGPRRPSVSGFPSGPTQAPTFGIDDGLDPDATAVRITNILNP